jgi:hypothetical protein
MPVQQQTLFTGTPTFSDLSAREILLKAPLPPRTETYTPIAHGQIMAQTESSLKRLGFQVQHTQYRAAMNGDLGQAEYHLQYGTDPEMGLMVAWQNSYNKMASFKYAIGAHVFVCANGMVAGDLGAYKRKHTGEADHESVGMIEYYLQDAKVIFDRLVADREVLKEKTLNLRKMAELMGRMYVDEQIINSTQLNIMKRELENPSYHYGVPVCNAWSLYNFATHAFKEDSPRNWLRRHNELHNFFAGEFGLEGYSAPAMETAVEVVTPTAVIETPVVQEKIILSATTYDDIMDMF